MSNLTPAQLQRKRANDRRLQRDYRARTRATISSLEEEVQHLRGSQAKDNESTRELHQRNKALEKEVQVEKQLRTDDGETIHQLRQRIQALEKEMQDEKQLRINDSEAIRELHHGNQVLEKELEYQKQLRINDSKTIHQLRHRYQLYEPDVGSLFWGADTLYSSSSGSGAIVDTASPVGTPNGELACVQSSFSSLSDTWASVDNAAAWISS